MNRSELVAKRDAWLAEAEGKGGPLFRILAALLAIYYDRQLT